MSLNIKNERVHAMVREAARLTGHSQTSVVEEAMTRLLAELHAAGAPGAKKERALRILADVDARLDDEGRRALVADDLYDEHGLPA